MPGRPDRGDVPARDVGTVAVFDEQGGLDEVDERAHRHRRVAQLLELAGGRAELAQHPTHLNQQVGRFLVAVVDERGVGRVQRDPGVGVLAHATGEAVVVGVDVGDHHALHVGHLEAALAQARAQGVERVVGVPARVDQERAPVGLERVHEHVAQRDRERYGDAPQARADLLDGRKRLGGGCGRRHRQRMPDRCTVLPDREGSTTCGV